MLQEKGRFDSSKRNYGGDNSRASIDKGVVIQESQPHNDRYKNDKAVRNTKSSRY